MMSLMFTPPLLPSLKDFSASALPDRMCFTGSQNFLTNFLLSFFFVIILILIAASNTVPLKPLFLHSLVPLPVA